MACTTILVGKNASYDGSTMTARNDDCPTGQFHAKKLVVVTPDQQPRKYKSRIGKIEIDLPDNPLRYTSMPSVDQTDGIWAADGINSENIAMTATETITTNERVLAADPLLKEGGIGEEDLVVITLPYIHSAREGVKRLGALLEKYGTYESNGIAFSDKDEIWWLETIGGHHYIARRVPDDKYVVMPNQFGLDEFDWDDAYGEQKEHMCSADLRQFVEDNHLDLNLNGKFNPRLAFGSHSDSDHEYNTPRAWYIERYLNPRTFKWDGPNADYTPLSDDIPWSLVPERKITVEDIKYALSSHYQGTPYDPYGRGGDEKLRGIYRPIGISRTSFLHLNQIRPYLPKEIAAIEWFAFGSNPFNAFVPVYANVDNIPSYFSETTLTPSTEYFYWANRLIGALTDAHYRTCIIYVERYQEHLQAEASRIILQADKSYMANKDIEGLSKANDEIAKLTKKATDDCLDKVLYTASCNMKNGFARSDN
ncbi:MAG: C69 family dipeptidase [Bacilli bacterium]|nr:C69 family dipeptidase [Bacilli bacterium]